MFISLPSGSPANSMCFRPPPPRHPLPVWFRPSGRSIRTSRTPQSPGAGISGPPERPLSSESFGLVRVPSRLRGSERPPLARQGTLVSHWPRSRRTWKAAVKTERARPRRPAQPRSRPNAWPNHRLPVSGSAVASPLPSSCSTATNPTALTSSSGWNCLTTWSLAKRFSPPVTTTASSRAPCETRSSTPPSVDPDSQTPSASPTTITAHYVNENCPRTPTLSPAQLSPSPWFLRRLREAQSLRRARTRFQPVGRRSAAYRLGPESPRPCWFVARVRDLLGRGVTTCPGSNRWSSLRTAAGVRC